MIKLQTPVEIPESVLGLGPDDGYVVLGSCFADEMGSRMVRGGYYHTVAGNILVAGNHQQGHYIARNGD